MGIRMVDISGKKFSRRTASASVKLLISKSILKKIKDSKLPKGDALGAAQAAGILAAKNTPSILPLCHPLKLTYVGIDFKFVRNGIEIISTVKAEYATGVEMEALAACAVAALTIYDMSKSEDKSIVISDLVLLKKTGGKSDYLKK